MVGAGIRRLGLRCYTEKASMISMYTAIIGPSRWKNPVDFGTA